MDVSKKVHQLAGQLEEGLEVMENNAGAEGTELLQEVASLTGLPSDWVNAELDRIVDTSGHDSKNLTLDELRTAMLKYLDEMQAELDEQDAAELAALEQMAVPGPTLGH